MFIQIVAVALGVVGLVGSILPVLPGIPVSWCGMLLLYLWGPSKAVNPITTRSLIIWLIVTVVISVVTYFIPAKLTKATGGSKTAARGSMVGTIIGIFFGPLGIILGAFLGAFLSEIIFERKTFFASIKSATGSFIGFFCNIILSVGATGWMLWVIIKHL